jgi:hypothetical protein
VTPAQWPERTLFIQCHRGLEPQRYQNAAVITQQFKLVGYPGTFGREDLDTSGGAPVLELYDLPADRGEERNLAAGHPELVRTLRAAYETWFDAMRAARGFTPGWIQVGSDRENPIRLSRYQDGHFKGDVSQGWPVQVVQAGRYEVRFFRGEHRGDATLVIDWNGRATRRKLPPWQDTARVELDPDRGILDIWLESPDGARLPYPGNDVDGDAILRRL